MKTLLLMRHAKSSHANPGVSDHDRPLNERGRDDAPEMARRLAERNWAPEGVICSTATRARETWELVETTLRDLRADSPYSISFRSPLYLAPPRGLLAMAATFPDSVNRGLLVAHNPGMGELVATFHPELDNFPTAAIARIDFDISHWRELEDLPQILKAGTYAGITFPKETQD